MGTGYVRNDTANNIADGNVINASDLDGEFDAVQAAFNATTGHSHDGTVGEGPTIGTAGIANAAVTNAKIANDAVTLGTQTTGNYVEAGATSGSGISGSVSSEGGTFTVTSNATNANTGSTIVFRDASGNFSAGTVTAALSGNATTATTLQTARTIGGVSFNGSANINLPGVNTAGNQNTSGTAAVSTAATVTTSATSSAFKVPFANTTASTTGNYGLLQDSTATFTYNPSTNTLVVGTVSAGSSVLTTTDINGGTIDGAVIGGASAAAGTFTTLTATGNVTLGNAATDTVTVTADVASNLIPSADNTYDLGASGAEWRNLYIDGTANIDSLVANTADINGGTIDGTVIGGSTPAAISGTTGAFSGNVSIADKIVHTGDTNTAIRFPAADTVTVETAGTERMRIDSSGNVGIGTSSVNGKLDVKTASDSKLIFNDGVTTGNVRLEAVNDAYSAYKPLELNGSIQIFATGGTERMRIDTSGRLLVGTSTVGGDGFTFDTVTNFAQFAVASGAAQSMIGFYNGGNIVGEIRTSTTATSYITSSDYRLKENIVDALSASDVIDAIQVRAFDWKADGSHQRYGMVAQELLEVAPEAVSAPKDPDDIMGVDYSKLVPMLVKEIQELRARVNALESE
jgi:hypothetical protein